MDATYLTDANGTTAPNGRQTSLVIGPITGATISPGPICPAQKRPRPPGRRSSAYPAGGR